MIRNVYFRLLLYVSFILNVSSETTLFVQKLSGTYNLTCIGNENSSLTWIGYENNIEPQRPSQGNPYKGSNVKLRLSYNFNLPPVLDWRWKDFRTESYTCGSSRAIVTNTSEIKCLTFSVRFKGQIKLTLIDGNGLSQEAILHENTSKIAFSEGISKSKFPCLDLQPDNPWRHFRLYLNEGKYYVSKFGEKNVIKFNIVSLNIKALDSGIQFKIHKYPVAALSDLIIPNRTMCRSIFYYTQRTSNITINTNIIKVHGMNSWKETTLQSSSLHVSSNYPITIDIRDCGNIEQNNKINSVSTKPIGCQNIGEEFSVTALKSKTENYTDNICQTYPELCKKRLICNRDGCYCLLQYGGDYCQEAKSMEVKRHLCKNGLRGPNCEFVCNRNCRTKSCNVETGECLDECLSNYYGSTCSEICPKNCKGSTCNFITGKCTTGCTSNFRGDTCDECLPAYWGQDCQIACSGGCEGEVCRRQDGLCTHGCKIGYVGPKCQKCPYYSWGYSCKNFCGRGCADVCNFINGQCKCRGGYDGEKCEVYTHLYEKPQLNGTGPDWIRLRINISEMNKNNSIKVSEKEKICTVQKSKDFFTIINLEPGTSYEFEVVVCYNANCSLGNHENQTIIAQTCTELDETVIQIQTSANSITIDTLKKENYCDVKFYKLNYTTDNGNYSVFFNVTTNIQNLNPYTDYEITIFRSLSKVYGKVIKTEEASPSAPRNLNSVEDDLIEWNTPLMPNGLLKKFNICINETCDEVLYNNSNDAYTYKLTDLLRATKYYVTVQAVNSLEGIKAGLMIYTKPPIPEITSFLIFNCDSSSCDVDIILENKFNSTIYETITVMESCEGNFIQKKEFQEKNIITLVGVHKNSTICVENNFLGKKTHFKITIPAETFTTKNAQLFYLFFLILILPITLLAFLVYRSQKRKAYSLVSQEHPDRVLSFTAMEPIRLDEEDTNIRRGEIGQYLKNLVYSEGGPGVLDIEFGNIRTKTVDKKIGILEGNSMKNRYKNIIPNDTTRVILKESSEDYINASYIQGYNGDRTYIATQCPKLITENDFWLMVWQEEVMIVVALSTLSEGPDKMCQYWPNDLSSKDYRKLKVAHVETEQRTDFVIRTFIISQDNIQRKIKQINYTTWPDKNIPIFPLSLIDLMKYVQLIKQENTAPIVVHCSAGIGRTGVYIMCDHYLNSKDETINIPQKLEELRKSRALVQTELQYRLVYFIVDEITNMDVTKNVSLELIKLANKMIIKEHVSNDLQYIMERAYLDKLLYSSMKPVEARSEANRNPRIKAVSESTIILPRLKEDKDSIYINAVYVHGYEQPNKFISTQFPLPNTVRDFWRLVYDKEPAVIIALQDVFSSNDESIFQFWPKQGDILRPTKFLEVLLENEHEEEFYTIYNLKILHTKFDNEVKTKVFAFRAWSCEKKIPNSVESFLALYYNVSKLTTHKSKIMLCCYDSAVGSGLYIAFDLLAKKIKYDKIFNVCWVVRSIRRFRNEFVSSDEQLVFLYQVASYYINNNLSDLHEYVNTPLCNSDYIDQMYENIFQNFNAIKF